MRGAGLNVGGFPVPGHHGDVINVKVPHLLSVLAFDDPKAPVRGLDTFPKVDRTPLAPYVRLAFIGGYGHHYLKGFLRDPQGTDVELPVSVASDGVDAPRAKQFAESLKTPFEFFDDASAMLARAQPDTSVVSVGSVYAFAGDLVAMAMERGFAVVSDKPIASSHKQLDRLRERSPDRARRRPESG